jgi:adenylate cyclase
MVSVQLHWVGRSEEALKCFDRAMALDPYFPSLLLYFGAQAAYQLGRYPEAVSLLKRPTYAIPKPTPRALLASP